MCMIFFFISLAFCLNLADFKMSCHMFAIKINSWTSTMLLPACFSYTKDEEWKECRDSLSNTAKWLALNSSIS